MTPETTDLLMSMQAPAGASNMLSSLLPFALILGIFYLFMIRPQQKERQAHEAFVASLQRDDRVVTQSGLHGQIVEVLEASVVLDVGDRVRIEFDKSVVARRKDAQAS